MTALDFLEFKLFELPKLKDDLSTTNLLIPTEKARRIMDAFEYVEAAHRSSET